MRSVEFGDMADRYYKNNNINVDKQKFIDSIVMYMKAIDLPIYEKSKDELNIDNIVSKSIIHHLNSFLNEKLNDKTLKIKSKIRRNKTLKH